MSKHDVSVARLADLRFSLRSLLVVVTGVAMTLAVGRWDVVGAITVSLSRVA